MAVSNRGVSSPVGISSRGDLMREPCLDPTPYGAHSLLLGVLHLSGRGRRRPVADHRATTRHWPVAVATRYVQAGQLFQNPASKAIGI